jgi:hypothetical protein
MDESVYILDEPFFQLKIDEHFAAHSFPLTSFRGSSIPLPYGAGGLWFYSLIRFFTWHPVPIAIYHLSAQILGAWLFLRTVLKAYGQEAAGWVALLVASSPLLFFLSRHPWDNTLLIPVSAACLFLLEKIREDGPELLLHFLLGLVAGYGLNIHLMFGPVVVALGLTLLIRGWQKHGPLSARLWLPLLAFSATTLLVLAPYLWEATRLAREEHALEHATIKKRWGDGRNLWWLFQRTALFSSIFGARIYLDDVRSTFYPFAGPVLSYFIRVDLFGWFGKLAAWGMAFAFPVNALRRRMETDPLQIFGSLAFFLTLLVYQYLNIPTAPHYFNPVWWFVFIGIGALIPKLRGFWKAGFLATLALTAAVNIGFDLKALAYVHENKGARNMQTSVVISEQLRMMREICGWAKNRGKAEVRVDYSGTFLAPPAFVFLPRHMPECQGVNVVADQHLPNPDLNLRHPADSATKVDIVISEAAAQAR